jgi:hypothetical protein
MSLRRSPRQMAASSPVATAGGREAGNAAFRAPTEVPTSRSGVMPRSCRARTIPACMAPGATADLHERGARRSRRTGAGRRAGGDGAGAHRRCAPDGRVWPAAGSPVTVAWPTLFACGAQQAEAQNGQAADGVEQEVVGRGQHRQDGGRGIEPGRCRYRLGVAVITATAHQVAQATCRLGMAAYRFASRVAR